jgi:hypothetical protein
MNMVVASVKTYGEKSIHVKHERGLSLHQNSWQEVDSYKA